MLDILTLEKRMLGLLYVFFINIQVFMLLCRLLYMLLCLI